MTVKLVISQDCVAHGFFGVKIISLHNNEEQKKYGGSLSGLGARTMYPTREDRIRDYIYQAVEFCKHRDWKIQNPVIEKTITWEQLHELLG